MWHKIWVLTEAASVILISAPQAAQLLVGGNTTASGGTMAAPNVAGVSTAQFFAQRWHRGQ